MKQTENLKLNLPERTDIYNLDVLNENFKILDNFIKELQNKVTNSFNIDSFTASPSLVTSGVETNIVLEWSLDDDNIDSQSIDDVTIENDIRTYSTSINITSSKIFTLKVIKNGITFTKTLTIGIKPVTVTNRFYYGSSVSPDVLTATDISQMSYKESTNNKIECDVSCKDDEYIIFALPKTLADSFGSDLEKSIYMGTFAGGLIKLKDIDGINNSTYTIMKSEYPQSESTVTISIK